MEQQLSNINYNNIFEREQIANDIKSILNEFSERYNDPLY